MIEDPVSLKNTDAIDRRRFGRANLNGLLAMTAAGGMLSGCRGETEDRASEQSAASTGVEQDASAVASSVPLRVLIVGGVIDADSLSRGWQSIGGQPLDISETGGNRDAPPATEDLVSASATADVIVGPSIITADLLNAEAVDRLRGEWIEELDNQWLPAVKNSLVHYAGDPVAVPVGSRSLAIVSSDELPEFDSWQTFDEMVTGESVGAAAIPVAAGWAGQTFLMRLAGTPTPVGADWLFRYRDFSAALETPVVGDALTQLKQCFDRMKCPLPIDDCTPSNICRNIASSLDESSSEPLLRLGIGFPGQSARGDQSLLQWVSPPRPSSGAEESNDSQKSGPVKILVDPFSVVAMIGRRCRQTSLAKTFCKFLSGDSSSVQTVASVEAITPVRRNAPSGSATGYTRWLTDYHTTSLTLPNLRILGGWRYYAALDQGVRQCLTGQREVADSLRSIGQQWDELTSQIGVAAQQRASRRSEGFRV